MSTPDDQNEPSHIERGGYEPPPLSLLDASERMNVEIDDKALVKNSLLIEKKFKDFDVDGRVTAIHLGPVVTTYEFEPMAGAKLSKMGDIEDDLSLIFGGFDVRVMPDVTDRAVVGIEVVNCERSIVWLRDVLSSRIFQGSNFSLPLALGCSTSGHPVVANLAEMPHVFIAGAAGSGMSVVMDSYILSLLYTLSPADLRLILIDSKIVDFSIYEGIPHLLLPVITKTKPAMTALRWALREMERRIRLMTDARTRDFLDYNEKIRNGQVKLVMPEREVELLESDSEVMAHTGTIPYIVIVINDITEYVDFLDFEECIMRLALRGKTAGIHLIMASRRPNIEIVKRLSNHSLIARASLKGNYLDDSQMTITMKDVQKLLGNGDMYFTYSGEATKLRLHGVYVTDEDVGRVVEYLRSQDCPIYN